MKIKLPHRTLFFTEEDKMLSGEQKVEKVNEILNENVMYKGNRITLEDYLGETFDNPSTMVIMDMLSYYITKVHRKKEEIMTRETFGNMEKGDGRTFPVSSMNANESSERGLIDTEDEYYI